MNFISEAVLLNATGSIIAGAVAGTVYTVFRMSRRYLVNEFGERMRVIFQSNKNELHNISQTRDSVARRDLEDKFVRQPIEGEQPPNMVAHKIVDIRPEIRRIRDNKTKKNLRLTLEEMNPEILDPQELPRGQQVVKSCPAAEAVARAHCVYKKRDIALLQSTFQKVYRFLEETEADNSLRFTLATNATARGFEPSSDELVALAHINSGSVQQKIRHVNTIVAGEPELFSKFYVSPIQHAWWWIPSPSHWYTNIVERTVSWANTFRQGGVSKMPLL